MTADSTKGATTGERAQKDLDDLLNKAYQEPGVTEAMEFYERVEGVYQNALSATEPVVTTTSSTNS